MVKFKKSKILKILLGLVAILVVFFITPVGQTTAKTLIILPEFIPNSPVKTINLFTPKPIIKEVEFNSGPRRIYADLWLPKEKGKFSAAVLHLGVDIDRKDPRIQKLANVFARSGVVTLVPNVPSLGRRRVLAEAKNDLLASFEYVKSLPNTKDGKIGFIGFCASGGITLLAVEEPHIADYASFLVVINPYYNLSSLFENITLRQIKDDGQVILWLPDPKTTEIFFRETITGLENKLDRKILYEHLLIIDPEKYEKGQFPPLSKQELNQLSKDGKHTFDGLTNKNQDKTSFYLENATDEQKKFIRELSPSTNIDNLKAKIFILSDKNNIYIPYTEAKLLDKALEEKDHVFVETKILPAGNLAENLSFKDYLGEGIKIFRFVYAVLAEIS